MKNLLPLAIAAVALTACAPEPQPKISFVPTDSTYDFRAADGTLLLSYQHATYPAPEGQNPAFARSAFIHPVNTSAGQRLTRIQPDDHYHHYGIWNPWTKTEFRGKEVDFWNLAKEQGTVRFAELVSNAQTPDSSSIKVRQEHIVFDENKNETLALTEFQTIAVSATDDPDRYLVDLTIDYQTGDEPFKIVAYRYGGLGWRATEAWDGDKCRILTSEGIPREGSDGSTARWVIADGPIDGENGGMLILSHPSNYNHPEPLRIWPKGNHDGSLFVNLAPTKTKDWLMPPHTNHQLRYRFVVFTGPIQKDEADQYWNDFAKL